jgi:hypothetical protein
MIITDILVSCNKNPLYYNFIPIFIKSWKILLPDVRINIIFISDVLLPELEPYKDHIILFQPIQNIKTPFIAQTIRILYPALLNTTGGVLITDMDMIPLNSKYFVDSIKNIDNNKFVCYRDILQNKKQLPICYNVASPSVWKNIFNINNTDDIIAKLKIEYNKVEYSGISGKLGWSTDQQILYNDVMNWNNVTNNFIALNDKKIGLYRLDRVKFKDIILGDELKYKIKHGMFSDYHMKRPYTLFKELNDDIVNCL